jgi:hypothetical protein
LFVLTGLYAGFQLHSSEFPEPWLSSIIVLIAMPLMLLLVTAMNAAKRRRQPWHPPDWNMNPFSFSEPFQFFHMVAWQTIVSGLVGCLLLPWFGPASAGQAALSVAFGVSCLLGIQLSMRVFHSRMVQDG